MRKRFLIGFLVPFFIAPLPEREIVPSGVELFFLEENGLPTVELFLTVRGAGSLQDPKGREGLASLAMETIRQGGSRSRRPEKVEEELERLGAVLESGVTSEYAYLTLHLLRKDLGTGLDILFDLLRNPVFQQDRFDFLKKQQIQSLFLEQEDPMTEGLRHFPSLIYGSKSAWGRFARERSLKKIKREDVVAYHRRFVAPDRLVIGASGELTFLEFVREVKIRTADWSKSNSPPPVLPRLERKVSKGPHILEKKGLNQSTILMGHLGERRKNPDKFALLVMNYILGGSGALSSRLGEQIRVQEGKSYAIWSQFGFAEEPGLFMVVAQTARSQVAGVSQSVQSQIEKMQREPAVTQEELERAQKSILRSFLFQYETRFALVKDAVKFYLWGYPEDYLSRFQQEIATLQVEDINRVARQYLHPDQLQLLVVGDPENGSSLKERFGKMKKVKR